MNAARQPAFPSKYSPFGSALVLQLELGFCSSQSPFVMIRLSNGLMVTPKERPGKGLGVCDRLLPDQGPDQA